MSSRFAVVPTTYLYDLCPPPVGAHGNGLATCQPKLNSVACPLSWYLSTEDSLFSTVSLAVLLSRYWVL